MPLYSPHLYDLEVAQHGADVRCKRKRPMTDMEDCALFYKKEKLDTSSSPDHCFLPAGNDRSQHKQHGQRDEGMMEVGLEITHNSAPTYGNQPPKFGCQPQRPTTPCTRIMHTVDPKVSPMLGIEDTADSRGGGCDMTSDPNRLGDRIEFCSSRSRGATRSPVSNGTQCSLEDQCHWLGTEHYVSDIY